MSSVTSNTLDASFCVEAYTEAVRKYGSPEIITTDQGSQLPSDAFVAAVAESGARQFARIDAMNGCAQPVLQLHGHFIPAILQACFT